MLEETAAGFLKEHGLWGRGAVCLMAVSGGVDSVSLLWALAQLRPAAGLTIYAAHLNHGLRPEADRDEAFVRGLCQRLGIPCTVGRARVAQWQGGRSLEMAARDIRRAFLLAARDACGAEVIFTAHHGNDQLETMLLRMARGTSLTGLAGIRPAAGGVARPLLMASRAEIEAYAREKGLCWVEDSSNQDITIERNRIRRRVTPELTALNPQLIGAVGRLSQRLQRDEDYIAAQAAEAIGAIEKIPCGVRWRVRPMHPAPMSRVMVAMMDASGMTQIAGRDVDALIRLAGAPQGGRLQLPQGRCAGLEHGYLMIYRTDAPPQPWEKPVAVPGVTHTPHGAFVATLVAERGEDGGFIQHFDADAFPAGAVARTRRPGDSIRPLGAPGKMSLKKAMNMRRVPSIARVGWPILALGPRVLWVPGAGLMDDGLACRPDTRRWLKVVYQGEEHSYGTYPR